MLQNRIGPFRDRIKQRDDGVLDDTREMALELLSVIEQIDAFSDPAEPGGHEVPDEMLNRVPVVLGQVLDQLRNSLINRPAEADDALLIWVRAQVATVGDVAQQVGLVLDEWGRPESRLLWQQWVDALSSLQDRLTMRLDNDALARQVNALVAQTEAALQRAQDASDKAQDAAGLTGNAALGTYFSGYARQELIAARWFRGVTIAAIVVGVVGVLVQGHLEPGDWTGVTFRLAIAAGAGTLAAYFGRQSGQHRRLYNWARSTQVQLESFPAFIEGVPAEERGEVYRTLARRILGAPPEKGGDSSEDSVGSAQLLDFMAALARRQLS